MSIVPTKLEPFNLNLLNLTPEILKLLRPVTVLDIFEPSSRQFHINGLFSIETFGRPGTPKRNQQYSYIDLKASVFHPILYIALTKTKAMYGDIMGSKVYAVWDKQLKDFVKSTPSEGRTGYHFFTQHWKDINLVKNESLTRTFNIDLINKYKDTATMSHLIVMPAGLRDLEMDDSGKPSEDEINDIYRKILTMANIIPTGVIKTNPESLDNIVFKIQQGVVDIYNYIKVMLEGKKKLIQAKWAGRKIYHGTRNVITTLHNDTRELHGELTVKFNETVVGLYQFLKGTVPLTVYQIKNGFMSKVLTGPNHPAYLVNKKTLKKEFVNINPNDYDEWMTEEGITKVVGRYGIEDIRHYPLEINGYWVGLVYRDDKQFCFLQDIDELPKGLDRKKVTPITFTELLYHSVYKTANRLPGFVTRYPITGFGSVYPSRCYLKTTIDSEVLTEVGVDGEIIGKALQFPITGSKFFNGLSPHTSHLGRLGADFDGDMCSFNIAWTEESIAEVEKLFHSVKYYVGMDGRIAFSSANDISELVFKCTTGKMKKRVRGINS